MTNRTVKVVKKNQVQISGSVCLTPSVTAGVPRLKPLQSNTTQADMQTAQVPQEARIIESNNEYAIIEVICSCGTKSHIQCNYAEMTKE